MGNKLFAVYLGGRAAKCNTELHDVVFGGRPHDRGRLTRSSVDKWFGDPTRLHLDSWLDWKSSTGTGSPSTPPRPPWKRGSISSTSAPICPASSPSFTPMPSRWPAANRRSRSGPKPSCCRAPSWCTRTISSTSTIAWKSRRWTAITSTSNPRPNPGPSRRTTAFTSFPDVVAAYPAKAKKLGADKRDGHLPLFQSAQQPLEEHRRRLALSVDQLVRGLNIAPGREFIRAGPHDPVDIGPGRLQMKLQAQHP